MKNNALNQVKEKNFICLLENNVGEGAPTETFFEGGYGWGFSYK